MNLIIMAPKQSLGSILCLLHFLLLSPHIIIIIMAPKRTFFFVRHITFAQFLIIIISPKRSL